MPRKSNEPPIVCQYFNWKLFRRDGVFYGDGRGGRYDLGKHSLGTRDQQEALDVLRLLDRRKAVELGVAKDNETVSMEMAPSIEEGWDCYLEFCGRNSVLRGIAPSSLKRYRAVRDKHVKFCSRLGIDSWRHFDKRKIEKYGNWMSKSYADRTIYFELTLLKSVVRWLIDNGYLPADCAVKYPLRRPQGTDTYCFSPIEVTAMIDHCKDNPKLVWLANVILALAHTGLRIGELAGLRWSDLDLNSNVICVPDERSSRHKQEAGTARTTKGRRSRSVPIHPRLKTLLLILERKSHGRVFHAPLGGVLRPDNVRHLFVRDVIGALKSIFPTPKGEIGFEHGRPHSFRHFFCSQAFLGSASEGEIKEWLGHADSRMVEHYRHLRNEDAQRKMRQIDFLDPNREDHVNSDDDKDRSIDVA
jgi:integrase